MTEINKIYGKLRRNEEKNSAKGLLFVDQNPDGKLRLMQEVSAGTFNSAANMLQPIFRDAKLLREETLSSIRKRLWK